MKNEHPKIIRTATVAMSLEVLLKGQLGFLNKYFNCIAISGKDEHLLQVAKREKVKIIPVTFKRNISPLKDLVSLWKLYKVLKKENPLIVHSITPKAGLLSMIAAYLAKVPIRIHTFTGLVFPSKKGFLQKLLIWLDRLLCKCATHVYPEGLGVQHDLQKFNITTKELKVLANGNINGIDTDYFNPSNFSEIQVNELKQSLGISKNDFVFVFIGRLVGDKGINELIAAFKKLTNSKLQPTNSKLQTPNSKLLLVGAYEHDLDPLTPETISEINCNANIITTGYKDDVRPYLAISDALVFPSYREGFPNVVLQAGAMGLPSIVTDINGCNEIIVEGENGLITPVKDENALGIAMFKLLNDKELRLKLAENARSIICNSFKQQLVWDALLEEYKILVASVL